MSCLRVVRKFDLDLLKLSDANWCQFFGEACLKKHFRINLKYPFTREIIRVVCNDGQKLDEPDGFISPKYWRNILDVMNSRYTLEGQSIKSMHDWKYIACCFFNYIASKPDIMNEDWLEEFANEIDKNMKQKNFKTIEDLINYIETYDQLDISKVQECSGDPKQCTIPSTPMTIEENSVSNIVNDTEQNLSQTSDSEETQISEELLDEKENNHSNSELTSSVPTELDVEHVEDKSSRISSKEPQSPQSTFSELNEESEENHLATDEKNIQHDDDNGEGENKVADNNPNKGITTTIEMVSMSEEGSLVIDIEESDSDTSPTEIQQLPPASPPSIIDETETRAGEMSTMDWTQHPLINVEGSASTPEPKPKEADENVNDPDEEPCPKKAKFEWMRNLPSKRIKLPKMPVSEEDSSESFLTLDSEDESSSASSSTICQGVQSMCDVRLKGQAYSLDEDKAITHYICKYNRHTEVKGAQLWKDMETLKICPNRSWQSMKERFKKSISKRLQFYEQAGHLKESDLTLLQTYGYNPETKIDKNPSKSGYTTREDDEIIKFIVENSERGKINGTKLWIMLSKHFEKNLKRDRTWQSLKERFKKRILPSIYTYDIEKKYEFEQIMFIIQECSSSLWSAKELKKKVAFKFQKN